MGRNLVDFGMVNCGRNLGIADKLTSEVGGDIRSNAVWVLRDRGWDFSVGRVGACGSASLSINPSWQ